MVHKHQANIAQLKMPYSLLTTEDCAVVIKTEILVGNITGPGVK